MHLLQLDDHGKLSLTTHDSDCVPPYAILSHTWGSDADELTSQDVNTSRGQDKPGFAKVQFCGEQARKDGYQHFWVDSCCIDKTSSSELSESINSMFRWYKRASKCYVYLQDVSTRKRDNSGHSTGNWEAAFRNSRWFTRGWTLQELLAPSIVNFYSRDWDLLGDKTTLESSIISTTGIPVQALRGAPLEEFLANERYRWAAKRQTKKKEDKAYCLFGIFNVFLEPIYGEEEHAFYRLQEAITRQWSQLDLGFMGTHSSNDRISIHGTAGTARWTTIEERRKVLMTSLAFDQMDARHSTIKDAQRSTCRWLLEHPTYTAWTDPDKPPRDRDILWINGKPGAGKSTLVKFAHAHAKKRKRKSQREILISFFNARGEYLEKTTLGMYRSLLFQLFQDAPDAQSVLDEVIIPTGNTPFCWTLEALKTVFTTAVADLGKRRLMCFVDALDECNELQARDMVSVFEDLVDCALEGGTQLCICFASRHCATI